MTKSDKLHAACVSVFGAGVLIRGASAVGKTECALGLVARGHRFIADDAVKICRDGGSLTACRDETLGFRAHVRDLGIIDAKALFGETGTADSVKLGLVVDLILPDPAARHPAVGTKPREVKILEVALPCYTMVAFPGRDLPLLIEIAVRRHS